MNIEVDALATEKHAFHAEAKTLFGTSVEGKLDLATRTYDALPRQAIRWSGTQQASDGAVIARITGGSGYLTVRRDFTSRYGSDHAAKGRVTLSISGSCELRKATVESWISRLGLSSLHDYPRGKRRASGCVGSGGSWSMR